MNLSFWHQVFAFGLVSFALAVRVKSLAFRFETLTLLLVILYHTAR